METAASMPRIHAVLQQSSQPASLPACLRQTPSIRHRRIAMETAASMPQPTQLNFFTTKSNRSEGSQSKKFLLRGNFFA
jgi:hypothetical protein